MRNLLLVFLACSGLVLCAGNAIADPRKDASSEEKTPLLEVASAVAHALRDNPGLAAIRARAQALSLIPQQRETLPEPNLSLKILNVPVDSFSFAQEGMTQVQFALSQALPYPGRLALRGEIAAAQAEMGADVLAEQRLQLLRDVRQRWWQIFAVDRALETLGNNKGLLRQFVEITQSKYRVGNGLQQDVLLAQLELSRLMDRELSLSALRRSLEAQLNALMATPQEQRWQLPNRVVEDLPEVPQAATMWNLALQHRPLFRRQKTAVVMAQKQVDLAEKDYFPDFRVGAAYGLRSGRNPDQTQRADFFSLLMSMSLPVLTGTRQDAALDQRKRETIEARYRQRDIENRVAAEIAQALADYQRAREQRRLFKQGIIPQAAQTVSSMRAGYQVNKVDFLNLMRTQMTLFNYQTRYWQTLSEAHQALARLAAAIGQENVL